MYLKIQIVFVGCLLMMKRGLEFGWKLLFFAHALPLFEVFSLALARHFLFFRIVHNKNIDCGPSPDKMAPGRSEQCRPTFTM